MHSPSAQTELSSLNMAGTFSHDPVRGGPSGLGPMFNRDDLEREHKIQIQRNLCHTILILVDPSRALVIYGHSGLLRWQR